MAMAKLSQNGSKKVEVANVDSRLNICCWQCMVTFLRHVQGGKKVTVIKRYPVNMKVHHIHTQDTCTVIIIINLEFRTHNVSEKYV